MEDKALAPQAPHLYMLAWGLPWSVLSVSGLSWGCNSLPFCPTTTWLQPLPTYIPAQKTCLNFWSEREGFLQDTLISVAFPACTLVVGSRERDFPWQSSLGDRSGKGD